MEDHGKFDVKTWKNCQLWVGLDIYIANKLENYTSISQYHCVFFFLMSMDKINRYKKYI
jgi:hypothetical protein